MSTGDPELDKKLNLLMEKLKKAIIYKEKATLYPIILRGRGPHFYWSTTDKAFLEVPTPSELYVMVNRGKKEGKVYVFSPGTFNRGVIYLIPEEKIAYIGDN